MIYKKDNIDMSLVSCPYEEQQGYISIEDDYTNNILKMSGYSDIDGCDFYKLCMRKIFTDKLVTYALSLAKPSSFYYYSVNVIEGRFELGEAVIATDAHYSYMYARYVVKGRFELGEPVIGSDPYYNSIYKKRFAVAILYNSIR